MSSQHRQGSGSAGSPKGRERSSATPPQLLRMVNNLEQAWLATPAGQPPPDLSAFLPPAGDPLRAPALAEMIRVDLDMRWRRGLPALLESYAGRFPELGGAASLPVELIYHEFRVRRQHGDRPELVEYQGRFPAQYRRLVLAARADSRSVSSPSRPTPPNGSTPKTSVLAGCTPSRDPDAPDDWRTCPPDVASGGKAGEVRPPPFVVAPPGSQPPDVPVVGSYRLLERLGKGMLGEVWKALAPGGVEVAVKRLMRSMEAQEAQYELQSLEHVKRLRHNYLAQIQAIWVHEGRLYVAMELADGSLEDHVKKYRKQGRPGIPHDELLGYLHEAAEALDYLHAEGVHHRDIKPANILLLKGHVKVADFGLARPLQAGESVVNATFCGTPAYMAPEVWENRFSTHSDQWSLAITYLELRLNRRVFKGGNMAALMSEIRRGKLDLAPLSPAEQRVVKRALRQDPRQRYPTCVAFVEALQAACRPDRPPPPRRRGLTALALLACLVAGGLLVAALDKIVRGDPAPPPQTARVQLATHRGEVLVECGKTEEFSLDVLCEHCGGVVPFVAEVSDGDVTVTADLDEGRREVRVSVRADAAAKPGRRQVRLRTADEALGGYTSFYVTILYLPRRFPAKGEGLVADGKGDKYYKTLVGEAGGVKIPFVLVKQEKGRNERAAGEVDPPTFYLSKYKITRRQFAAFREQHPDQPPNARWLLHAAGGDEVPVRDVTCEEAYKFALWLGGHLPTQEQWDKAAGRYQTPRGEGPYKGRWADDPRPKVAVGKKDPVPVESVEDEDDVSPYDCCGMAGNGFEWTRDREDGRKVPAVVAGGPLANAVIHRGWDFQKERPLTFADVEEDDEKKLSAWPYRESRSDISFRVVLEPNATDY